MPASISVSGLDPKPGDRRDSTYPQHREYGLPLLACPEARLWPITLAFARGDPRNPGPYGYNVVVRWLAMSPYGGVSEDLQTQVPPGCKWVSVSDLDLPSNLKARVNKPAANIQHLIIYNLTAPKGEGGKAQCFRLFVKVTDAFSHVVYFNTCVKHEGRRVIDHLMLVDPGAPVSVTPNSSQFEKDGQTMRKWLALWQALDPWPFFYHTHIEFI
ncbi:hypothetical protein B0T20DRAFT_475850 [Sordaria brevicollis]|uniref:Uncharacterized protein n=1 Tax=Sordaria brevicollis TaxID=83679 RepID=A0AAE0UFC0_SORBR|nr:hypothetical protein B0T20DRAFT_475850 [Sordaria brevicollis]